MSRFIKSRSAWDLVAAALLVLTTAELTACRPRRHESAEVDEVNRRFWDAFADEWDRRAAREQERPGEADAPSPPKPQPAPVVEDDALPTEAPPPAEERPRVWQAPMATVPDGATPMDQARACLRNNAINMAAGNQCVVQVLRGRASTESELGLLAVTYRAMGRTPDAVRAMRLYIQRFPDGPRAAGFSQYIANNP
jgi:hypothetical protein